MLRIKPGGEPLRRFFAVPLSGATVKRSIGEAGKDREEIIPLLQEANHGQDAEDVQSA